MILARTLFGAALVLLMSACVSEGSVGDGQAAGGEAAAPLPDVSGVYTVNLRYGKNGCAFNDWPQGSTLLVDVIIQQNEEDLTAVVEGIPGGFLWLIHGSNEYSGTLEGSHGSLVIYGSNAQVEGNCSFTYNNYLELDFSDDFVSGQLSFSPAISENPDCEEVACTTEMTLNGTRPPKE